MMSEDKAFPVDDDNTVTLSVVQLDRSQGLAVRWAARGCATVLEITLPSVGNWAQILGHHVPLSKAAAEFFRVLSMAIESIVDVRDGADDLDLQVDDPTPHEPFPVEGGSE